MYTLFFVLFTLHKIGSKIFEVGETDSYFTDMGTEFWLSCITVLLFFNLIFKIPFVKNFKILDK